MSDWTTDPRPIAECLKDWHARPGWTRNRAADELCVSRPTYDGWCAGRGIGLEKSIRKLMVLIDREYASAPDNSTTYGDA
jgi:hypothetical protein